jgi:hypothetical protein
MVTLKTGYGQVLVRAVVSQPLPVPAGPLGSRQAYPALPIGERIRR